MSDPISGINNMTPTYPVKPAQPSNKDREPGKRKKERPAQDKESSDDDDNEPLIDEYV